MACSDGGAITHRFIETNGIKMHIAEQGSGRVVLLLHGFPELWYSWRHQIPALAAAGYHVVAPDMRGYGQTDAPSGFDKYTTLHVVGDLIGLLDALNVRQCFVAGHDWGAIIAWDLSLFRPDRVKAIAALSVPFMKRRSINTLKALKPVLGDGFYFFKFQYISLEKPGIAEADFARSDTKTVMKKILLTDKGDILVIPEDKGLTDILELPTDLPPWITEEEFDYYAEKFSHTGFTGGLNYYRAYDLSWELKAPWNEHKVEVPAMFVSGERDLVYHFPGFKDYIDNGQVADVPKLEETVILPSAHFMQQEKAKEVNELLINFFGKH